MRSRFYLILLCSGFLSFWVQAGDSPAIVILGDSISAAYNMEINQSWPKLLQQRLVENNYPYRVFNSSIAGDTTQGGLTRLPRLLDKHHPAIVIIELGGNDGLRGISLDVTRANLLTMIELSRAAGAAVLLTEMKIPPNYGMSYTRKFNEIYGSLSKKYDLPLIPFLMDNIALDADLMQADGIHPNARAQAVLLDNIWPTLEPEL